MLAQYLHIINIIKIPENTRDEPSYPKAKSCGGRERARLLPLIPRAIEGEIPARQRHNTKNKHGKRGAYNSQ